MQIVLGIFLIIIIGLVVFYYKQCEKANKEIYNLESLLDDKTYKNKQLERKVQKVENERDEAMIRAEKKISARLYTLVFQEQHYNNIENLQNKIKTILDDLGNH